MVFCETQADTLLGLHTRLLRIQNMPITNGPQFGRTKIRRAVAALKVLDQLDANL
jgi:hypothetical protein